MLYLLKFLRDALLAIEWLPQWKWSNPEQMGKFSLCLTIKQIAAKREPYVLIPTQVLALSRF